MSLSLMQGIIPIPHVVRHSISEELFNVKDKLTDNTYVQLMNILAGKREEPDITNAKFVSLSCDEYYVYFDDDLHEPMVGEISNKKKIFEIIDGNAYDGHDENFMDMKSVQMSKGCLMRVAEAFKNNKAMQRAGSMILIKSIDVLHRGS